MRLDPYLFLDGRAREAIAFYVEALGAEVERIVRYRDVSGLGPRADEPDSILHAVLRVGGVALKLSDRGGDGRSGFSGFAFSLTFADEAALRRTYERLAAGGEQTMRPRATFFAELFGTVIDRFGVRWQVEVPETRTQAARPPTHAIEAPFDITVCGIEELADHLDLRATHVLSILDPDHPVPEAFGTWHEHEKLELRFHDIVVETEGEIAPGEPEVRAILALGRDLIRPGAARARLVVHCHAGISRSTAAMVLVLAQAMPDRPADAILELVHGIREKAWPNLRIVEIGDRLLGRDGSLVRATTALHRRQLGVRPKLAELMTRLGRGREVEAAQADPVAEAERPDATAGIRATLDLSGSRST